MIDNNTLSLKLDYYFGGGTTHNGQCAYPCTRVEVVDATGGGIASNINSTVLYKIKREAIPHLTSVENVDIAEIVEKLIQKGIVLFFNEDNQSVSIKQVENVWAELKDYAISSNHTVSTVPPVPADTAEENVEETADEATDGNDNEDSITVGNDEYAEDAVEAENTEDTTSAGSTGTVDAPEESGCWNTALIILGSDVVGSTVNTQFILHIFHEKALEAGKYSVEVFAAEEIDSDTDETAEAETATESASEDTDEDNNENEVVDRVEVTNIGTVDREVSTINTLLFIIREIFHIDVFDPRSLASSDSFLELEQKKTRIEAMRALANKHFFLNNPHKNVEAEGIMMGDGKRIIVKAGSRVSSDNRLPNQKGQTSSASLREKLINDGVIADGTFVNDYEFTSTRAAASVILGQSASGMTAWKDYAGRKLESLLARGSQCG